MMLRFITEFVAYRCCLPMGAISAIRVRFIASAAAIPSEIASTSAPKNYMIRSMKF